MKSFHRLRGVVSFSGMDCTTPVIPNLVLYLDRWKDGKLAVGGDVLYL